MLPHWVEAARGVSRLMQSFGQRTVPKDFFRPQKSENFAKRLEALAACKPTYVSLEDLYRFGLQPSKDQSLRNAQFMHHELPIRLAHKAVGLRDLPFGLNESPQIQWALASLEDGLRRLVSAKFPVTHAEEEQFASLVAGILLDHRRVPHAIAGAVHDLRLKESLQPSEQRLLDRRLDDFFIGRISMRFLTEHYIASHDCHPGFSGVIATECCPHEVVKRAARDVADTCLHQLGVAPEISVLGDPGTSFRYVPSHTYFIASELLKNSCRAAVEAARREGGAPRAVRCVIVCGRESEAHETVSIKVADESGGIKRSDMADIFSYTYSTAPFEAEGGFTEDTATLASAGDMSTGVNYPMAGLGVGLPLARLYSNFFGGNMDIISMEGYGTDAYVSLPHWRSLSGSPVEASPAQAGGQVCLDGDRFEA